VLSSSDSELVAYGALLAYLLGEKTMSEHRNSVHAFGTADAKAMQSRARTTLIHLIALMEAEFLEEGQLQSLPDSMRPKQCLKDLPSNWFSKPIGRVDWAALEGEAKSTIADYQDLLFCLHAVRQFKLKAAEIYAPIGVRESTPAVFKEQLQGEIHKLRSAIVRIALRACAISDEMLPGAKKEGGSEQVKDYGRGPYAYQIKSSARDVSLDRWDHADELSVPAECCALGCIPRLVVFDARGPFALNDLVRAYETHGGEVFLGEAAWAHVTEHASKNLRICINRYCRDPLSLIPLMRHFATSTGIVDAGPKAAVAPKWARMAVMGRC